MSNWNLESFDNLFATLAESTYTKRPSNFTYNELDPKLLRQLTQVVLLNWISQNLLRKEKKVIEGGQNLPNDGIVYLQPDKSLKSIDENVKVRVPDVNGGYHSEHCVTNSYQKGY